MRLAISLLWVVLISTGQGITLSYLNDHCVYQQVLSTLLERNEATLLLEKLVDCGLPPAFSLTVTTCDQELALDSLLFACLDAIVSTITECPSISPEFSKNFENLRATSLVLTEEWPFWDIDEFDIDAQPFELPNFLDFSHCSDLVTELLELLDYSC